MQIILQYRCVFYPESSAPVDGVGLNSSGKLNVKDNELEDMLKEATGPINFTMFLNLFGEKLHGETCTHCCISTYSNTRVQLRNCRL